MIKLFSLTLPPLPILGSLGNLICSNPDHRLRGWRVAVRGPAVFLVSPAGWKAGEPLARMDQKGPRRVIEVPRTSCVLNWDTDDADAALGSLSKYDGEPMGLPTEPAVEEPATKEGKR